MVNDDDDDDDDDDYDGDDDDGDDNCGLLMVEISKKKLVASTVVHSTV